MTEPACLAAPAMVFERNDQLVIEAFRRGDFDYLEGVGEVSEADFFRLIAARKVLEKLAATYPTQRQKHDVPLWVYIASDISMRFHGVHAFNNFAYVVRAGGLINAFGPKMGHKVTHPTTGDVTLSCAGFNDKNEHDRETPCDQDHLRKMAKATEAELLMTWFNRDVVGIFKQHHAFDPEGIVIGDATYLIVPDNENYQGTSVMLFDKHNHPVDSEKLSPAERSRCQWRRCYKLVSLIHINRAGDLFLYAGLKILPGKDNECPVLYHMVEQFVGYHGRGIIKKLILDRGFLDGPNIGRCKLEWDIDILIPARKNMDIYRDVVGMAEGGLLNFVPWVPPTTTPPAPPHRSERIRKREAARQLTLAKKRAEAQALTPPDAKVRIRSEVAAVAKLVTFSGCPVPLHAVINRETQAAGEVTYWVLITTAPIDNPFAVRQDYALRTTIEERHRQLKCFSDLESFSSPAFNLVVNQVVFTLLTYSLLQWYLMRIGRRELNTKTRPRTLDMLRPTLTAILIYYQNYVACLSSLEHTELVLTLKEGPRKKILAKTRRLRRGLAKEMSYPRSP